MKNLLKLGTALNKMEQQAIKGGLGAGGAVYELICTFSNGEYWIGSTDSWDVYMELEGHCHGDGGSCQTNY